MYCSACLPPRVHVQATSAKHVSAGSASSGRAASKSHEKLAGKRREQEPNLAFMGGVAVAVAVGVIGLVIAVTGSGTPPSKSTPSPQTEKNTSTTPSPVKLSEATAPRESSRPAPLPVESVHERPLEVARKNDPDPPTRPVVPITPPQTPEPEVSIKDIAAKYLAEAKAIRISDPASYKEKLARVATTYRSTPSGAEAMSLLLEIKDSPSDGAQVIPVKKEEHPAVSTPPVQPAAKPVQAPESGPAPAIAMDKDATPIFDGKTLACLDSDCLPAWKLENGAIVSASSEYSGGQSRNDYSDGNIRFRFENGAADEISFEVRQNPGVSYRVAFGKAASAAMAGKTHEVIFQCDGGKVTATRDGNSATVTPNGQPRSGRFRFAVDHGSLKILAIDFQKLPAK